jgi:DNA-binding NtrC family response regulator
MKTPDIAYLLETILRQQAVIAGYERLTQDMAKGVGQQRPTVALTDVSFWERVAAFEKELMTAALLKTGGNLLAASKLLQLSRKTMEWKMKHYGMERPGAEAETSAPVGVSVV